MDIYANRRGWVETESNNLDGQVRGPTTVSLAIIQFRIYMRDCPNRPRI